MVLRVWAGCLPMVLALCAASARAEDAAWTNPLEARLAALGAAPCADSALTCLTLSVPRDHRANDRSRTLDVTFAVSLAAEESRGMMVYVVGGPGTSGVALAEGYLDDYDPALIARFDVVFFDQRGMGASGGLSCPDAQAAFDVADLNLRDTAATLAIVQAYVTDCTTETGGLDLLPHVGTDQAIRDVEAFRQAVDAPQIWMMGESYGTQFAQQYATAFPHAIRGVILDGTIDLTLSLEEYYHAYATAAEDILQRVFSSCDGLAACAADMGGPAAEVYDRLAADLLRAPAAVALPLGTGETVTRHLTGALLEGAAFYALYGPADRAAFLRAIAASGRGDLLPLLRLAFASLLIDPATGEGGTDPAWFGAAYYAVTCLDYAEGSGDPAVDAAAVIADGRAYEARGARMPRSYFAERLVCALWPARGGVERPAPYEGGAWPTIILNADADPITPVSMARAVFDAAANASLVVMEGGPHVIWGRGLACPDEIMAAFLSDGVAPAAQVQHCEQPFLDRYVPIGPPDPADALAFARAVAAEMGTYPELAYWDYATDLVLGCNHGGSIAATGGDEVAVFTFDGCSFWPGLSVSGSAEERFAGDVGDGMTLRIVARGHDDRHIIYRYGSVTEAWSLEVE